ncbi:MAG TPA: phospholipase D-like domain-containing protein [Candidatus Paceibacterota bacterium]
MPSKKRLLTVLIFFAAAALGGIALEQQPTSTQTQHKNQMQAQMLPAAAEHFDGSLIIEPQAGNAPVLAMIQNASSSIDMVMYELQDMQIEQALANAAARGVAVRVLLNGGYYGKPDTSINQPAYDFLQSHGVLVRWTPAYFALTHEKALVADKREALIMTFNLTPRYYASSRDFGIDDKDSADIVAIEQAFDDDWQGVKQPASQGDDLLWSPQSADVLLGIITSAHKTLDVYNEEMSDTRIIDALASASERGVRVRVVMTYSSNWKSAFIALEQAGASVHTYAAQAPLYIHAKMIVADGTEAFVGSQNFSATSLDSNREGGLVLADPEIITQLEKTFQKDYANAQAF